MSDSIVVSSSPFSSSLYPYPRKSSSMTEYRRSVEFLAKTRSEYIFDSEGAENASIIISSIFRHSDRIIRIYAHNMNGEISSEHKEYLEALSEFLYEGKQLLILLDFEECFKQDKPNYNIWLIRVLQRFNSSGRIDVRLANEDFKKNMTKISTDGSSVYHFTVGDDTMFRIEKEHDSYYSICSFNNRHICKTIIQTFDAQFYSCKKILF